MESWTQNWDSGIPFSTFTIRNKDDHDFVGYIGLGFRSSKGASQIAIMIRESMWNKGYGYETVGAISLFFSQVLIKNHFKVEND